MYLTILNILSPVLLPKCEGYTRLPDLPRDRHAIGISGLIEEAVWLIQGENISLVLVGEGFVTSILLVVLVKYF